MQKSHQKWWTRDIAANAEEKKKQKEGDFAKLDTDCQVQTDTFGRLVHSVDIGLLAGSTNCYGAKRCGTVTLEYFTRTNLTEDWGNKGLLDMHVVKWSPVRLHTIW